MSNEPSRWMERIYKIKVRKIMNKNGPKRAKTTKLTSMDYVKLLQEDLDRDYKEFKTETIKFLKCKDKMVPVEAISAVYSKNVRLQNTIKLLKEELRNASKSVR